MFTKQIPSSTKRSSHSQHKAHRISPISNHFFTKTRSPEKVVHPGATDPEEEVIEVELESEQDWQRELRLD